MSSKKTILITGSSMVPSEIDMHIERRGYRVRRVAQDNFTAAELHDALDGVSGYLIGGYEEPLAEHFERSKILEAAAWVGTDYKAYVPGWRRAYELGIAFINSPGTNAVSVAEFTVLLALSMNRPFLGRVARSGEPPSELSAPGQDLFARQIGIIGLGRIGAAVARIASMGFQMRVAYHAPRRNYAMEQSVAVEYMSKEDLLKTSDIISLHRPGPVDEHAPELDRAEFALMKDGAILINTAHHELVSLEALEEAIRDRNIRAAFDGVAHGDAWNRLLALGSDRFMAVPSMAFNTSDANLRASLRTADAVCDVLDGKDSIAVNNPDYRECRANSR